MARPSGAEVRSKHKDLRYDSPLPRVPLRSWRDSVKRAAGGSIRSGSWHFATRGHCYEESLKPDATCGQ